MIIVGGIRPAATAPSGLPALAREGLFEHGLLERYLAMSARVLFAMNLEWLELKAAYLYKTAFFSPPAKLPLTSSTPTSLRSRWYSMAFLTLLFLNTEFMGWALLLDCSGLTKFC